MRLLHTSEQRLYEFTDHRIPPYAILSHTWGDNEVTHHEFLQGKRTEKITRSCALAASESWDYIWIDTCCIDKSSSAELSEAINSMYRWYQMAEVCYAYLEDVSVGGTFEWFSASRWFTRGWTLQELLAPTRVIFLDHAWRTLGSKSSLEKEVSMATRIERSQLAAPMKASAAAKMSWMSRRKTTRIEDMAYCLLGLFEVNIPLLYGEGERAFTRLQEEIIRQTDDQSIFAWIDRRLLYSGMLARHPSAFAESGNIAKADYFYYAPQNSYKMTNTGLKIKFPALKGYYGSSGAVPGDIEYEVPLDCKRSSDTGKLICITLKEFSSGKSCRTNLFELKTLNLPKDPLDVVNKSLIVASSWSSLSPIARTRYAWTTPKILPSANVQSYFPHFKDISGLMFFGPDYEFCPLLIDYMVEKTGAPSVNNKKLVFAHDHEIISMTSDTTENRAATFSSVDGDVFVLYWWQDPEFLKSTAIEVYLAQRPFNRQIKEGWQYTYDVMFLRGTDISIKQLINVKGKALYIRLRHEIHDQRRQLVIDVDVIDIMPEAPIEVD